MSSEEQNYYSHEIYVSELPLTPAGEGLSEERDLLKPVNGKKIFQFTTDLCTVKSLYQLIMVENLFERSVKPLTTFRDTVADYQESRGIPRDQTLTFFNLLFAMGQYISQAILAVAIMMYSMMPLLDAFIIALRFLVDKLLDAISPESEDTRAFKFFILILEFIAIAAIVCFTFCLIVIPLLSISISVFYKALRIIF